MPSVLLTFLQTIRYHPSTLNARRSPKRPGRARVVARDENLAYERLRSAIASGALMPNERLVETVIAQSYGVGRDAVRMALARLAQESLIERLPNRGARVRRIFEKEALEILEARVALESLAVRYAALNATPEDVERLDAILAEMATRGTDANDEMAYAETNAAFHNELLRIADHQTVTRLVGTLRTHTTAFRFSHLARPTRPGDRLEEHRTIAAAVAAHDPDAAERAMNAHLRDVIRRRRERLAAQPE